MRIVYEESMRGRTVIDSTGRAIGEVAAVMVDTESWRIDGVRVRLRREVADAIGARRSTFHPATIDVGIAEVQGLADALVLRSRVADLRQTAQQPSPPSPPSPP